MIHRRSFLLGLGAAVAAPAIIRPGILMPVKQMLPDGVALWAGAHPISVPVLRPKSLWYTYEEVVAEFVTRPDAALLRLAAPHDRVYGVVMETKAGFFRGDVVTLRSITDEPSSGPS